MRCLNDCHTYELDNFESPTHQHLQFIQKEEVDGEFQTVANGTTNEELLAVLVHRITELNKKAPCRENSIAITHIETALLWLNKRTADRKARGVEGTPQK